MTAYYNEIDPYAAEWIRNLINAGHIAPGVVDERSIEDVSPDDLADYTQCHFFAGVGVWSYALRLAGWPDNRPVWTGSCPCQPFSSAGKGAGFADERHLWPAWFHLIRIRRPPELFGEQVDEAIRYGWLDLVCDDLEAEEYTVGALRFGSDLAGAPIERQRIYFTAKHLSTGVQGPQPSANIGKTRPWGWCGEEDLRLIAGAPFEQGDRWPQPLFRGVDDVPSSYLAQLRAYGNAINAKAAANFITAYMECRP